MRKSIVLFLILVLVLTITVLTNTTTKSIVSKNTINIEKNYSESYYQKK